MDSSLIKKYTLTLEAIMETDQQAIKDFRVGKITASDLAEINMENVITVKKIISEIGFPTISLTSQTELGIESFEEYKKIVEQSLGKK